MSSRVLLGCLIVAGLIAACLQPASHDCGSGVICPAGFVCSQDNLSCIEKSDTCATASKT